ncbi:hypothetical protein ACMDB5_09880 [Flavobacterium sp. W1B]
MEKRPLTIIMIYSIIFIGIAFLNSVQVERHAEAVGKFRKGKIAA